MYDLVRKEDVELFEFFIHAIAEEASKKELPLKKRYSTTMAVATSSR